MKLQTESTVARNDAILFSDLDDSLVMMSIDNGEYYSINAIGKRIWTLLEKPLPVADLCETLLNEFEVDSLTCQQDVLVFINEMHALKVIKAI